MDAGAWETSGGAGLLRRRQGVVARVSSAAAPWPAVQLAQFVLGLLEIRTLLGGELAAGAVDVEVEHRHGRGEGCGLAPLAALG